MHGHFTYRLWCTVTILIYCDARSLYWYTVMHGHYTDIMWCTVNKTLSSVVHFVQKPFTTSISKDISDSVFGVDFASHLTTSRHSKLLRIIGNDISNQHVAMHHMINFQLNENTVQQNYRCVVKQCLVYNTLQYSARKGRYNSIVQGGARKVAPTQY
jgi:hypothetical protein